MIVPSQRTSFLRALPQSEALAHTNTTNNITRSVATCQYGALPFYHIIDRPIKINAHLLTPPTTPGIHLAHQWPQLPPKLSERVFTLWRSLAGCYTPNRAHLF